MEKKLIFNLLDGLYAFDTGSTDCGIQDEILRQQVIDYLDNLNEDEFRILMSNFIRESFVSHEAIQKGYGIEDVAAFIKWLDRFMGIEL